MKRSIYMLLLSAGLLSTAALFSFTGLPRKKAAGNKKALFFSAVNGTISKTDTVLFPAGGQTAFELSGKGKDDFTIVARHTGISSGSRVVVAFKPPAGSIGIARASLVALDKQGKALQTIALTGLSAKGLEGENEPPLARVFEALGYRINLGWTSLANHCEPEMQGDELPAGTFRKAGTGPVRVTPVARYSPDFRLPFGFYTNGPDGPSKNPLGALALAGEFPEHQALFPRTEGELFFDPGTAAVGFYVSGPDHTAYSEDRWNEKYHPENVAHASRVYQARNEDGKAIPNAYFFCFEEASNGDYNDYVFLVENITVLLPAEEAGRTE